MLSGDQRHASQLPLFYLKYVHVSDWLSFERGNVCCWQFWSGRDVLWKPHAKSKTRDWLGTIGGWFAGQSPQTQIRGARIWKQGGNSSQDCVQASGFQDSFMHGPFQPCSVWLAHCDPPLLADGIGRRYRTLYQDLALVFVRFFRPRFRLSGARSFSSPVLASCIRIFEYSASINTIQIYLFYNFGMFRGKCLPQTFALTPT